MFLKIKSKSITDINYKNKLDSIIYVIFIIILEHQWENIDMN
jgi:hypothetical protein